MPARPVTPTRGRPRTPRRLTALGLVLAMLAALLGLVTTAPAAMASTAQISGTITGDSAPLEDAEVLALIWDEEGEYWDLADFAYTDADGEYSMTGLGAGEYTVLTYPWEDFAATFLGDVTDIGDATTFELTASQIATGKDIAAVPGATVTGTVTDPEGDAPEYAELYALRYDTTYDDFYIEAFAEADENGAYTLAPLSPGTYTIVLLSDGEYTTTFLGDVDAIDDAETFELALGATATDKDIQAIAGGTVSGRVTLPGGAGRAYAELEAYRWSEEYQDWEWESYAEADGSGNYTFTGLPAGEYTVAAYGTSNYVTTYLGGATDLADADSFTLDTSGNATGKNIQLVLGATVAGTVFAPGGGGVIDADVVAFRWDEQYEDWIDVNYESTNAVGAYSLGGLGAGTYRIGVYADGYPPSFFGGSTDLDTATSITLTSGELRSGLNILMGGGTPPTAKKSSSTTLTLSPASRPYGRASTATVRVTGAGSTPTGAVALRSGGKQVATATLVGGVATFPLHKGVGVGTYAMSASYGGSSTHLPSASTTTSLRVTKASAAVTAKLAKKKIKKGKRGAVDVKVTATGFVPKGVVRVKRGAKTLVSTSLDGFGSSRLRLPKLKPGKVKLTVVYAGSAATTTATSKKLTLTVKRRK